MAQRYAVHDLRLTQLAELQFVDNLTTDSNGNITSIARSAIPLQFPPKILSDNRKGNWNENNQVAGKEPVATIENTGPREFALLLTYIVDGDSQGTWTTDRISKITHRLRGYYALMRNKGDARNLFVNFKYIGFGGSEPITCYIRGIDVKHGDTLMYSPSNPEQSFPLRTDVTLDMRIWVRSDIQDVEGQTQQYLPEWF